MEEVNMKNKKYHLCDAQGDEIRLLDVVKPNTVKEDLKKDIKEAVKDGKLKADHSYLIIQMVENVLFKIKKTVVEAK